MASNLQIMSLILAVFGSGFSGSSIPDPFPAGRLDVVPEAEEYPVLV